MLTFIVLMLCASISAQVEAVKPEFETKSIFFGGGNWYIDHQQKQELYDWIDSVPDLHEFEIVIHSHTDNIGGKEYNAWLSQMRSDAVFQILEIHEIPADWLFIRDYGQEHPDFSNDSYMGRLNNRRVDVILIPPSS